MTLCYTNLSKFSVSFAYAIQILFYIFICSLMLYLMCEVSAEMSNLEKKY